MINEEKVIISNDINIGATIAYQDKKQKRTSKLSKLDLIFGKTNLREFNPDFNDYLDYRLSQISQVLKVKNVQKFTDEQKYIEQAKKILVKRGITNV